MCAECADRVAATAVPGSHAHDLVAGAGGSRWARLSLNLLPEAIHAAGPERVRGPGLAPALGVPGFSLLEKRIFRHHSHSGEGQELAHLRLKNRLRLPI